MKRPAISLMCVALTTTVFGALDTGTVERVTGWKGLWNEKEGVFKVSQPRTDVKVTVDGWPMPPFMGLTPWAAFTEARDGSAMVMGDLVLFQDEVNPVMSAALNSGLAVTALHNHFFYDEPKVYFMHVGGEGSVSNLAVGVRRCFDTVKDVRAANPTPATHFGPPIPVTNSITAKNIEQILGVKGQENKGMFKVVIGRKATMHGTEIGKEIGVNTWAAFAGADDNAVVDGDFAVQEDELQPVLKTLRATGINIVAIHQHMTHEAPRILFLHYWGRGPAEFLAKGIKAALQTQERP
jgi:hypothetical protein